MKQLILTMLFMVAATMINANDVTISGFIDNSDKVTIQVYDGNTLIQEKTVVFKFYKLKLKPGKYRIYFTSKETTKVLHVDIKKNVNVAVDLDFSNEHKNASLTQVKNKVEYILYKE